VDKASRLLLFLDVVEAQSFSKAADHRQVNRSVVSKQISRLEEELQIRLFNRSTRSLALTDAGREIHQHALRLREVLEDTDDVAGAYQDGPRGILKITSPSHFGRTYVAQAVRLYMERYPDTQVEVRLEDHLTDLIGGGYDLAIRMSELEDSNLIARPLAAHRHLICASPAFIERHGMPQTPADLTGLPAAVYSRDGFILDRLRVCTESGVEEKVALDSRLKVNDADVLIGAIKSGACYGMVSAINIKDEILNGELVPLLTNVPMKPLPSIHLVYPHRQYLPQKTRRFSDCLQEVVGTPPVWEQRIPGFENMYGYGSGCSE